MQNVSRSRSPLPLPDIPQYIDTDQFIKEYRLYLKGNGITNTHIAKQMGISPQQLQNIFKKNELTVSDLKALCSAINTTAEIKILNNFIRASADK